MNGSGDFNLDSWSEEKWKEEPIPHQTYLLKLGIQSLTSTCHERKESCDKRYDKRYVKRWHMAMAIVLVGGILIGAEIIGDETIIKLIRLMFLGG